MRQTDKAALFSAVIFKELSAVQLNGLLSRFNFEIKTYKKHEKIFTPDSFSKSLAIILKGSVFVYKETGKAELLMNSLSAGAVFGMSSMFYEEKCFPTTVSAKEDCRILFITKEQLLEIFAEYPQTVGSYIAVLSEKIHYLNSKISGLCGSDAAAKLRTYLENAAAKAASNEFILPVSFSELSQALSIGRTSLYRAFDELSEQGFLEKDGKIIKIKSSQ